jgi:hypothetical protein
MRAISSEASGPSGGSLTVPENRPRFFELRHAGQRNDCWMNARPLLEMHVPWATIRQAGSQASTLLNASRAIRRRTKLKRHSSGAIPHGSVICHTRVIVVSICTERDQLRAE